MCTITKGYIKLLTYPITSTVTALHIWHPEIGVNIPFCHGFCVFIFMGSGTSTLNDTIGYINILVFMHILYIDTDILSLRFFINKLYVFSGSYNGGGAHARCGILILSVRTVQLFVGGFKSTSIKYAIFICISNVCRCNSDLHIVRTIVHVVQMNHI